MTRPPRRRLEPRAQGWSLRSRVAVGVAGLSALLIVLLASVIVSLVNFVQRGDDVIYRWEPAAATSQDLLADLVNQETGVRGYAISGRDQFLQPYTEYLAKQAADHATLAQLVKGHRNLESELAAFDTAARDWQTNTAQPLIVLVRNGNRHALQLIDNPAGKARFDLVRTRAKALSDGVDKVSKAAIADRRQSIRTVGIAIGITSLLMIAAAVILWRTLTSWVLGPVELLAEQTREVAGGNSHKKITPSGPPEFTDLGTDVETMRGRIAEELLSLEQARDELARSNADLEQFAYVASHDLSEPLRKVANFCQLLERQYSPQLDDKARQYIAYAVDGARRMQILIADLLALSRVGRNTEEFVAVDTAKALERALGNIEEAIEGAGAEVKFADLPTVPGDPTLIASLFENLVGNAIKYRSDAPPRITVTAQRDVEAGLWTFTVTDNGIGIDAQYADRIFAIFQRLHLRDQYGGTGIGLALCRRIVEFHGGRIWLDTTESPPGATFRFTLPEGTNR